MSSGAYLDWASHAPLHPAALEAFSTALRLGDPARLHHNGRESRQALELSRSLVATALGARPDEVFFTPSGTESLRLGILGALAGRSRVGHHVAVSAVEHSAVFHALDFAGAEVTVVGVDSLGRVSPEEFVAALRPDTALAVLQSANHEVGTAQPVVDVGAGCAAVGVPLLVDGCVTMPWAAVPGAWSLLVGSAHKWGGPAGVGVLIIRTGTRWRAPGPTDERGWGRVAGFENVPAIVAAAHSLRAAHSTDAAPVSALVDRLRAELASNVVDCVVLGSAQDRAPHIVTASMLYVDGESMLIELDKHGIAASSGSSCSSSTLTPSHVLEAMGALTHGNLRLSLGPTTTDAEVDHLLQVLPQVVAGIRSRLGADGL